MSTRTVRGSFTEGGPIHLASEWPNAISGSLWQISDFTSVSLSIFDKSVSNSSTAIATPSRSVSAILTNTPGTWLQSAAGPNFNDDILEADATFEGGHHYRFEYSFIRVSSLGTERLVFMGRADPIDSV